MGCPGVQLILSPDAERRRCHVGKRYTASCGAFKALRYLPEVYIFIIYIPQFQWNPPPAPLMLLG